MYILLHKIVLLFLFSLKNVCARVCFSTDMSKNKVCKKKGNTWDPRKIAWKNIKKFVKKQKPKIKNNLMFQKF